MRLVPVDESVISSGASSTDPMSGVHHGEYQPCSPYMNGFPRPESLLMTQIAV
jgi:hypothetical protein